ncbi:MAG: ribonuclease E inhibitor RraB [Pyrinomonadaceae bacterium]
MIILLDESDIQAAVERHATRNRELKKLIESKGVDPASSRSIDLHFWAFGETAANNLASALQNAGYSPVSKKASESDSAVWSVETQFEASPLSVSAPFFVEGMVRLAAENEGEFDGWGTSL